MNRENVIEITSDYVMEDVDCNFKIIAGPGAGKTYWLINHIKNVLKNSKKLHIVAKIACITYTNVAVEEIQDRLEINDDRVEVSTIHSFLYKNVVKPYIYLLKDDNGECIVNYQELGGHDEHVPSKGKVMLNKELCAEVKKRKRLETSLIQILGDLDWSFESGKIVLEPRHDWTKRACGKLIDTEFFTKYKRLFWDEGIIHHEDVLYFSYNILKKYSIIRNFISAKYPYIFIDEFQDTNPIQTQIIKWIGEQGSIIGVIGDPAQSIYKFQGASRDDFIKFNLHNQKDYIMTQNRRSTKEIINLLSHMRGEDIIKQGCYRKEQGKPIYYIEYENIKEVENIFHEIREEFCLNKDYCVITPSNKAVSKLKSKTNQCNSVIWDEIYKKDLDRGRLLEHIFSAQEIAKELRYEVAIKEMLKVFKTDKDGNLKGCFRNCAITSKLLKRSLAVALLEYMINNMETNMEKSVLNFYNDLNDEFFNQFDLKLTKASRGAFKDFAETLQVKELVDNLKLKEEKKATIRTIHKAKGAEFQSVLVFIENINDIEYLFDPDINHEEDNSRLYYVAFSRAEDFLCIAVPKMNKKKSERMNKLNIKCSN